MNDLTCLINLVNTNKKKDYYKLTQNKKQLKKYEISVIIPIRDRTYFVKPVIDSFKKAIKYSNKKIGIMIVEHSTEPLAKKDAKSLDIDYFWVQSKKDEPFNKCLCHNIGAIMNKQSQFFLFHDLDCLVYDDFFINIDENIKNKNAEALQCFKGRRVLCLDEETTTKIINNEIDFREISLNNNPNISATNYGAPGGSILVKNETFFHIGGFDPEIFSGYSPEDKFFWIKLNSKNQIHSSDNPVIEVLHMYHKKMYSDDYELGEMGVICDKLNNLNDSDREEFYKIKKDMITNFK